MGARRAAFEDADAAMRAEVRLRVGEVDRALATRTCLAGQPVEGLVGRDPGPSLLIRARLRRELALPVLLADKAVFALGFKTSASLLKTLELGTWRQIGAFAAVFALRTVLKRAFAADKAALLRGSSGPVG